MKRKAFTLIELMIVVVVITILVVVAIPKFNLLAEKAKAKTLKGNLSIIRGALNLYYSANSTYPTDDLSCLVPDYLNAIPVISIPNTNHRSSTVKTVASTSDITDSGHLSYVNVSTSSEFGTVFVDCTHTDLDGVPFSAY